MLRRKPLKRTGSLKRTPLRKISERGKLKREEKKLLIEEDKEFYQQLWDKEPHTCRNCKNSLGKEPLMIYFHHVLEKRNYKEYRHKEWNIIILCWQCHQDADQNKIEIVNRYKSYLLYKLEKGPQM